MKRYSEYKGAKGQIEHQFTKENLNKVNEQKTDRGNRVWLIPYNKKYFDLKGCYDKFGEVYWTQHCRFKVGDTGYIYGSAPESAIRFSFKVVEADMPYDPIMDREN